MFDIVGIGELLIDFTPIKIENETVYKQNAGGAPCNMLVMANKLGSKTSFIGKVGNDGFGKFLAGVLSSQGVNTEGLVLSDIYNTTLAFVHLDSHNDRSFSFYRKNCADIKLSKSEVNYELINECKAFHFGSLSFTNEPSKSAVLSALRFAKQQGKLITYDPNYRASLWNSKDEAICGMKLGLDFANIIKVSEEEAALLTGENDLEKSAEMLLSNNVHLVCITLGEKGCYYKTKSLSGYVEGFKSKVKDTTGAGDAFFGALVHKIISDCNESVYNNKCKLEEYILYANAVASLCVQNLGGIPSLPSKNDVDNLFSNN